MMDDDCVDVPDGFRGLDLDREIDIYRRGLPHWRQAGATYFVTFRLADALPQSALCELRIETRNFKEMVERFGLEGAALRSAAAAFSKSFGRLLDRNLDAGGGSCLLRDPGISKIVLGALDFFNGDRYELYSAVVMPNHCHLLVRPFEGWQLEDIIKSWKGFSGREINKALGRSGTLWQADSFDRIVRDEAHYRKVVRYIRGNPLKAGLAAGAYRLWEGERVF